MIVHVIVGTHLIDLHRFHDVWTYLDPVTPHDLKTPKPLESGQRGFSLLLLLTVFSVFAKDEQNCGSVLQAPIL